MADVKISELMQMQHTLAAQKGWLKNRTPDKAHMSILWSIDELGEAIAIIKKKGADAIMENPSVREHYVEEVADVFMYLLDMMESYGITAEEFSDAYIAKFRRNMGRDWVENDTMYESVATKKLFVSLTTLEGAPEQAARMVEVLSKTDVALVLLTYQSKEIATERLLAIDISPDSFTWIDAEPYDSLSVLLQKGLAGDEPATAALVVWDAEERAAAEEVGVRAIECESLTEVVEKLKK